MLEYLLKGCKREMIDLNLLQLNFTPLKLCPSAVVSSAIGFISFWDFRQSSVFFVTSLPHSLRLADVNCIIVLAIRLVDSGLLYVALSRQ